MKWRISRAPLATYVAITVLCFAITLAKDLFPSIPDSLTVKTFYAAGLMLIFLPIVLTMRFRDMGRSVLWPLVSLAGPLILTYMLIEVAAGIGGGDHSPVTPSKTQVFYFAIACMILLLMLTLWGLFGHSKHRVMDEACND